MFTADVAVDDRHRVVHAFCLAPARFMLVFRRHARDKSNSQFSCLLERDATNPNPRVCLVGRRCCVFWGVCTGYTLHHTPRVNTWEREKRRTTKTDER